MRSADCRVLVCLAVGLWAAPARAENIKLTIIHTNDIHGWVMPRPATFHEKGSRRTVGGLPAFSAWLKKTPTPRLVLDTGDWFQGTPEGAIDEGRALVELFNAAGGDDYAAFSSALDMDITRTLLRDVLYGCARKHGQIIAPAAGRLLPVGD
ncbi:MAG: metallophosphoesterase [Elusimicrobia bacterium]|nr:metallophosphoesterase [Elusimicrobiota bacterium]